MTHNESTSGPSGNMPVINGILNVNKPAGMTSMEMVRRVKRASHQKHVGHAGTLDPIAIGVVPVCLGQATRVMEYLLNDVREYFATIELGVERDTYDIEGEITAISDISGVTRERIEQALSDFRGEITQVPPMYSALKVGGKRLYKLARSGVEIERKPRQVSVSQLSIASWEPPILKLSISCGRGFYVRSLAHDLGTVLGCGAHLNALTRTLHGPFNISSSMLLAEVEYRFAEGTWQQLVYPLDVALGALPSVVVESNIQKLVENGHPIPGEIIGPIPDCKKQYRVYNMNGKFCAVLTYDLAKGIWHPDKVFDC